MIPVDIAVSFDRVQTRQKSPVVLRTDLDDDEKVAFDYLDATIESGIYASFDGGVFDIKVPVRFATEKIIAAIGTLYNGDNGKWQVGVFNVLNEKEECVAYQIVFAPGPGIVVSSASGVIVEPVQTPTQTVIEPVKSEKRPVRAKPKVLLVSDVPGWAFDQNMKDLEKYLSHEFEFGHFYTENWFKGMRPEWDDYDVIYEAYHRNPPMGMPYDRALGALRSQFFKPEKPALPDAEDIMRTNRYRGFQVAARRNLVELAPHCPRVVYLTNPVDTKRFTQTPVRDEIIASWNGNAGHRAPDGRYIKGYYDYVVPACMRARVPLVAAEYGTTSGPSRRRAPGEMTAFYQQANVALCASEYEAASNSSLEAMSSGLALIATDVGNHRELRDIQVEEYGDSGILLVEREVDAFVDALKKMTPKRAREMGEINRKAIEARWSWTVWQYSYSSFLRMAL